MARVVAVTFSERFSQRHTFGHSGVCKDSIISSLPSPNLLFNAHELMPGFRYCGGYIMDSDACLPSPAGLSVRYGSDCIDGGSLRVEYSRHDSLLLFGCRWGLKGKIRSGLKEYFKSRMEKKIAPRANGPGAGAELGPTAPDHSAEVKRSAGVLPAGRLRLLIR